MFSCKPRTFFNHISAILALLFLPAPPHSQGVNHSSSLQFCKFIFRRICTVLDTGADVSNVSYFTLTAAVWIKYHKPHFIEEMEVEQGTITFPGFQSGWFVNLGVKNPGLSLVEASAPSTTFRICLLSPQCHLGPHTTSTTLLLQLLKNESFCVTLQDLPVILWEENNFWIKC